ncbi:MAG: DUF559 domain-containing protein [bacterium]|nr:DUF559 domain-containing protein [bacterium]
MINDSPVLVAIINRKKDWKLLQKEHWYRIPVKTAPEILKKAEYLAFYQTKILGKENSGVQYFAKIKNYKIVKRIDLLPDEPEHPSAYNEYYKITVDKLEKLPFTIPHKRARNIVFIPSTLGRLLKAQNINDLYHTSYLEEKLYKLMQKEKISPERQWFIREDEQHYCLDFAIFCNKGNINVECDGEQHYSPKSAIYDNDRNNALVSSGWAVLRFRGEEIIKNPDKCIRKIKKTIDSLKGLQKK